MSGSSQPPTCSGSRMQGIRSCTAVKKKLKARKVYETLTKTNRYAIAYGLTTAKKPETRDRRFEKFLGMLERGEKPDFGFKKK